MSKFDDFRLREPGVLGKFPAASARPGVGRNTGRLDVSGSIWDLEDEGGVLLAGPPARPKPRAARAAERLARILRRAVTGQRQLQNIRTLFRVPRTTTETAWLRSLERNYNHQHGYYTVIRRGNVAVLTPIKPGNKFVVESILRQDLKKHLGAAAEPFVTKLKGATRFRKLTDDEFAELKLSDAKRRVAIERSKGHLGELAKWLFDKHNWIFLVARRNEWAPSELAGFFELPKDTDLECWPITRTDRGRGDQAYLNRIWGNISTVRRELLKVYADRRLARAIGGVTGPEASKKAQALDFMILSLYKKKLHPLAKKTKHADILRKKLISIEAFWK